MFRAFNEKAPRSQGEVTSDRGAAECFFSWLLRSLGRNFLVR